MSANRQFGFAHVLLLILLMAGLVVTVFLVKDSASKIFKSRASGINSTDFQVELGEEEYVLGPSRVFFDNLFSAVPTSSGIRAFTAGGVDASGANSYGFSGSDFRNLQLDSSGNKGVVLPVGKKGEYDDAGAWLNSVEKIDENHWLGWYHAEKNTPPVTRWSMALAHSYDGGKSWSKAGQVVTTDDTSDLDKDDAGSGKTIKVGNYFYLFYLSNKDWKTHVARSPVSELGKPGSWQKYYNGSFSEPGLGGKSTPVNGLDGNANFVVYNSYLNRFIAYLPSGKWGFFLYYTKEGNDENTLLNWQKIQQSFYPFVSTYTDGNVDHWLQADSIGGTQPLGLWGYGSIIGPTGDSSNVGQEFYVYYMRVFPGENIGFDRYLMRRKVTLYKNSQDPYFARVALVRYEKANPKKTMVSTEIAKPSEGYIKKSILGYLLPYQADNFKPLYDCYIPGSWDDRFVSWADPGKYNWQSCENNGDTFIRRIGYISKDASAKANIPVYRCFNEAESDHFVSTDSQCEGKKPEGLIGFLLSAQTSACGSACTYNETRQDAIDKACNATGSCPAPKVWKNPLVCHAGIDMNGICQWASSTSDKCYNPSQGCDCVCE